MTDCTPERKLLLDMADALREAPCVESWCPCARGDECWFCQRRLLLARLDRITKPSREQDTA